MEIDSTPPRFVKCFIDNKLQVADILEENLRDFKGLKDVVVLQATFSISEEFLRRIWRIKRVSGARFILAIDRKALQKTRLLWRFIANVYDEVFLSDTHAKILLVNSPSAGICRSVITSQNLTRGNRFESTFITSERGVFDSLSADFYNMTQKHSVPMHEILPVPDPANTADNVDDAQVAPSEKLPDIYAQIEAYAEIFLPISDIAVILEIEPALLREAIASPESPEARAYARGKAKAKAKIRAQEMQLAQLGSPLGVQNVRDNLIDMEADE